MNRWALCYTFLRGHAFLRGASPEQRAELLEMFPPSAKTAFEELSPPMGGPLKELMPDEVHASWFLPFLSALNSEEIGFYLSALSETQRRELKKSFPLAHPHKLSSLALRFARSQLTSALLDSFPQLLPAALLPEGPFNTLLSLTSKQLDMALHLLGLHDLSFELSKTVEAVKIKRITAALTPLQAHYLKHIMQKKEPNPLKRMDLDKWDGSKESLEALLMSYGLNRLAKALHGEEPSLLLHIAKQLDYKNGQQLKKLSREAARTATSALRAQVIAIATIVKERRSK